MSKGYRGEDAELTLPERSEVAGVTLLDEKRLDAVYEAALSVIENNYAPEPSLRYDVNRWNALVEAVNIARACSWRTPMTDQTPLDDPRVVALGQILHDSGVGCETHYPPHREEDGFAQERVHRIQARHVMGKLVHRLHRRHPRRAHHRQRGRDHHEPGALR